MSKDILEFQIYDFREENIFPKSNDSDSEDENALPKYVIHTFGKTMEGKSVYCKVTDYTPYFFVATRYSDENSPVPAISLKPIAIEGNNPFSFERRSFKSNPLSFRD